MIHDDSEAHDPILGTAWAEGCAACLAARNSTFAQLRAIEPALGPDDPTRFIRRMQEMARDHLKLVV
jgi:hypothetical protein